MSDLRKISITEALNELKLYDSKITKAINNAKLTGAAKKSADKVGVTNKDDFIERAKASYQSITDLIANRNALKSAIVKSNAITEVTINGKTMTVAEAIERKNSIEYDENLLTEMKRQYAADIMTVDKENKKVDAQIDKLLETFTGKDGAKQPDKESMNAIADPYREKNEYELIDGIGIFNEMLSLESDIDGFRSNCDTQLVLSNATHFIEI